MKHETLEAALVAALAEMPAVGLDETNLFLKNRYASLGAMIKTSQPVLAKHGLGVIQPVKTDEVGRIGIETRLIWEGGASISTVAYLPLNLDAKNIAQDAGSSITYLRRYSLASMLGMYADEDTDGNGNQPPAKAQTKPVKVEMQHDVEPKMALDTAEAVLGSDGVAYGKKVTAELGHMFNQIAKNLKKPDLSPDERDKLEYKRDAIEVILNHRANTPAATGKTTAAG